MRCCQIFTQGTALPTVSHAGRPLHSAARNTRCIMVHIAGVQGAQAGHSCMPYMYCTTDDQLMISRATWWPAACDMAHRRTLGHAPCCRKAPNHRALQHTSIEALARQRSNAYETRICAPTVKPKKRNEGMVQPQQPRHLSQLVTVTERHTQDATPASQSLRTMRFLTRKKLPKGCIETCKMQTNSLFLLQGCHFTK
jgi:hypothetical protein